jgi:hypothetical protein
MASRKNPTKTRRERPKTQRTSGGRSGTGKRAADKVQAEPEGRKPGTVARRRPTIERKPKP